MKAMIFAAGLGTRLKPITDSLPKALVPICGKPLLEHVLEKLEAAGYDDIVVNTHHFAELIHDYVADRKGIAKISISHEKDLLLDTGGGVRRAEPLLVGSGRFLVHNVDIISNLDLEAFAAAARDDSVSTLVVSERKTSRYLLFDDDLRLVGWTDVRTGEVKSPFPGLDPSRCRKLAFSGIHMMTDKVFPLMEGWSEKFPIIDFYLKIAADHPVHGYIPEAFSMIDVGKLDTLAEAEELFSKH